MPYAICNVIGPSGELVKACEAIPEGWPEDLVTGLLETGGAVDTPAEAADAWVKANEQIDPHNADALHYLDATRANWEGKQ